MLFKSAVVAQHCCAFPRLHSERAHCPPAGIFLPSPLLAARGIPPARRPQRCCSHLCLPLAQNAPIPPHTPALYRTMPIVVIGTALSSSPSPAHKAPGRALASPTHPPAPPTIFGWPAQARPHVASACAALQRMSYIGGTPLLWSLSLLPGTQPNDPPLINEREKHAQAARPFILVAPSSVTLCSPGTLEGSECPGEVPVRAGLN